MTDNNSQITTAQNSQSAITPTSTNTCLRTGCLVMLLLIGVICIFVGAIFSSPLLLVGIIFGIGGAINLVFSALQHTHSAEIIDNFIGLLSTLPYLQWAKFVAKPLIAILVFLVLFLSVAHIPFFNDRICQRTFISWNTVCGNALGTVTENVSDILGGLPQVKIGLIDTMNDGPFDIGDQKNAEVIVDQKIFAENHSIAAHPYITLAVITELSRTSDDPSLSANVGLADLEGAYIFQEYYNSQPAHIVKLRLIIGNIGTRLTVNNTVPFIMGRIALLAKQDSTFRGILGLPFSGSTADALNSRKNLAIDQIPIIAPSTSADDLANINNFYRIVSPDKTQSCVALDFTVNHLMPALKYTSEQQFNIAIFRDNQDYYSRDLANDIENAKTGNINCNSYSRSLSTNRIYLFPELYTIGQPQQDFKKVIDDAILKHMDVIFFSGYSDDLKKFETSLSQEQNALHYQKRMLIVGGDGLYEATGSDNTYNTIYTTVYIPPLTITDNTSDLERFFVTHYQNEFDNANSQAISSGVMFPPHVLEMYDAAYAFTTTIQNTTIVPGQEEFDQALHNTDFNGLTGLVQFNGNPTDNPTRGISDPLNKDIYVMCTNKNATTAQAAVYSPGPTPAINIYLDGQSLLQCTALQ